MPMPVCKPMKTGIISKKNGKPPFYYKKQMNYTHFIYGLNAIQNASIPAHLFNFNQQSWYKSKPGDSPSQRHLYYLLMSWLTKQIGRASGSPGIS